MREFTPHETRVGSLGQEDPLQKERATHSGILAWEIVRIEELCLEGYSPWGNKKLDTTERVTLSLLSTCTSALCLPPMLSHKILNCMFNGQDFLKVIILLPHQE